MHSISKICKKDTYFESLKHLQNLHNHTLFSDGKYPPDRLALEAINSGIMHLGISDHFYTTKVFKDISYDYWYKNIFLKYLILRENLPKYLPSGVKLWFGVELDSCLARTTKKLEDLPWNEINTLDYMLIEYLGEVLRGGLSFKNLFKLKKYAKIPIIIAHPNPTLWEEHYSYKEIFAMLVEHKVNIEISAGVRNFRHWNEMHIEHLRNLKLVIGSDTHDDIKEVGNIKNALDFLVKHDLLDLVEIPISLIP